MGVPFEALLPYGIMIALFGVTGAGLSRIRHMQNGGKRPRRGLDQWDRVRTLHNRIEAYVLIERQQQMMDRDRRLTGFLRGQTDHAQAPPGFELNSPWRVESRII